MYSAYQNTATQTESQRDKEYRLLGQVTAALIDCEPLFETAASDPVKMAKVVDAVTWNKKVWDLFIHDSGLASNPLPKDLRSDIVSLGIWVNKETGAILDDEGGDINALIAVNRAILRGLAPSAQATELPQVAPNSVAEMITKS